MSTDRQTDRRLDMKIIVTLHNFADAPSKELNFGDTVLPVCRLKIIRKHTQLGPTN